MSIDFVCPECGAEIEAPDNAVGKAANCPECDTKLVIPGSPKPQSHDEYYSPEEERPASKSGRTRRPSRRSRRVQAEEVEDSAPRRSSRRRRAIAEDEDYSDYEEHKDYKAPRSSRSRDKIKDPNYFLWGGIGAVVLVLLVVLIVLLKGNEGSGNPTPNPQGSQEAGVSETPTPTPPPTPTMDENKFFKALSRIASTNPLVREKTIAALATDIFSGGKESIRLLVELGVMSTYGDVRVTANDFLVTLTNAPNQEEKLYSEDKAVVEEGIKAWETWWNENKDKSIYDLVSPALSGDQPYRLQLALALGFFKDKLTVPLLFNLLEDENQEVRQIAYNSVKNLLANDKFDYSADAGAEVLAISVKQYRDWWDSIKDNFDFKNPEKSLP